MSEFMLLMKGDDSDTVSPEQMQGRMQAYMGWMQKMTGDGVVRAAGPLEPTGRLLKNADTVLTDGPFLEPTEIIGGYVIVEADDIEAATTVARGCPLLEHCEIMVRPLIALGG
jgi:hypothetical protein